VLRFGGRSAVSGAADEEGTMAVARVTKIIGSSPKSWQDAA